MADHPYDTVDPFDRLFGALHGLPDVIASRESTITVSDLVSSATYIVQTVRQREQGDTIFVQRVDKHGAIRIPLPPKVAEAIARQREALTDKSRSKAAKATAAERKRLGIAPAFTKRTKRGKGER